MSDLLNIHRVRTQEVRREAGSSEEEEAGQEHVSKVFDLIGLSIAFITILSRSSILETETDLFICKLDKY